MSNASDTHIQSPDNLRLTLCAQDTTAVVTARGAWISHAEAKRLYAQQKLGATVSCLPCLDKFHNGATA